MSSIPVDFTPDIPGTTPSTRVTQTTWHQVLEGMGKGALWTSIAASAAWMVDVDLGVSRLLVGLVLSFLGFALISLGEGIMTLLYRLAGLGWRLARRQLPGWWTGLPVTPLGRLLGSAIFILADNLGGDTFLRGIRLLVVGEVAIVMGILTGGLLALAWRPPYHRPRRFTLLAIAIVLDLLALVWVVYPGRAAQLARPAGLPAPVAVLEATAALPDPGAPGPYTVRSLSYGSGDNPQRPEYDRPDLLTSSVDGSAIYAGYGEPVMAWYRWYWQFDYSALPLNGLVWYPEGDGPFPLVLIVHGNHFTTDFSDPGYAYLGQHLASHGYIAASIDENFLNGGAFFDGEGAEMPLRAWLLLQHLEQWRAWNDSDNSLFSGRVDLERVALVGHSRGGEAAAHAAEMNRRPAPPVTRVPNTSTYRFNIRGVVAIAPSDRLYEPSGKGTQLRHSSYLFLGAGHDADATVAYGISQYNRVRFEDNPDGFKALAYVYRANHGQYNTVWGNRDQGTLNSSLLNRGAYLSGNEQRQAAQVLITAFLEAAVRGEHGYRSLFFNPVTGHPWLPADIIVTGYAGGTDLIVDSNKQGSAATHVDVSGGLGRQENMQTFQTKPLLLRDGETAQENSALRLAWQEGAPAAYQIVLPPQTSSGDLPGWHLTQADALSFSLAPAGQIAPAGIIIELASSSGTARLPLDRFGPLYPQLPATLAKTSWLPGMPGMPSKLAWPAEVVLQTYTLPLSAFVEANPAFDPAGLTEIRFLFSGTQAGDIYLDEVGFARLP